MRHPSIVAAALIAASLVFASWLVASALRSLGRSVEHAATASVRPDASGVVSELMAADEPIRSGDVVEVTIFDLTAPGVATTRTLRVGATGKVPLVYVGELVAGGQTPGQFEKAVADAFRQANIIQNPHVSVSARRPRG